MPKKGASNAFKNNKEGPKKIWVLKVRIIRVADVLDNRKDTLVMVPEQWLLIAYDRRKVYVPMPDPYA